MIPIGGTLGQFRIQKKIGSGGMGTIYEALDTVLHRKVALKVIHDRLLSNPQCLEAFRKEAATQAQLVHPNIVSLYAFQAVDNHFAMVLEHVEGESMRDSLRKNGPLTVVDAVNCMKQLLRGLLYAHGMNIVHLDIKPGNLIRTRRGQLKISDFGIAAIAGLHPETSKGGYIMATPWYAAPEQLSGGPVDHRSDLYSSGVTLYEMLTGEIPFSAEAWDPHSPGKWIEHITEPELPSKKRKNIPGSLDAFVIKSLRKKPENRYHEAGEMLESLDEIENDIRNT